jgi:hypothetical protein
MKGTPRRIAGIGVALAVTLVIAGLSRVPYTAAAEETSLIRLSWRTPGAYVEECRRLSAEEIERLPVHMRREEVCEGRILPYRLRVIVNGRQVYDETVRPAGAREDRPLYVFRELSVAPGEYQVDVLWEREDVAARVAGVLAAESTGPPAGRADDPPAVRAPARATTTPERLTLAAQLRLEPGDISLLTYDLDRQRLVARGRGVVRAE